MYRNKKGVKMNELRFEEDYMHLDSNVNIITMYCNLLGSKYI